MKIAVVGATGLVGSVMIKVLEEQNLYCSELIPAASERSVGKTVEFKGKQVPVVSLQSAVDAKPDLAIFSAGSAVSLEWAPRFAATGSYVVDNSSAWRMQEGIPLIIPEVNIDVLKKEDHIIANPNCSTIQMLVALNPLRRYGIRSIEVSTYQSVSGSGVKGISQMNAERENLPHKKFYARSIDLNCIPQCDDFTDNGYTKEEMKLVNETRKIFGDATIDVNPTAARVAVAGGHSEAVKVTLKEVVSFSEISSALSNAEGLVFLPGAADYVTALEAAGKDEVFVSRVRKALSDDYSWNLWIVSDNLRKGAATNAVQIAAYIAKNFLLKS